MLTVGLANVCGHKILNRTVAQKVHCYAVYSVPQIWNRHWAQHSLSHLGFSFPPLKLLFLSRGSFVKGVGPKLPSKIGGKVLLKV